jgi:hypothetical protein
MRASRRRLPLLLAAAFFAALPIAFGLIRAISTGTDVRYLWLAGAALAGSALVIALTRQASSFRLTAVRTLAAVAAGAACAAAAALLMGTKAGLGLAVVAVSFGLCTGVGVTLASIAREPGRA